MRRMRGRGQFEDEGREEDGVRTAMMRRCIVGETRRKTGRNKKGWRMRIRGGSTGGMSGVGRPFVISTFFFLIFFSSLFL